MRVNSAINEANAKNCRGIEASPLPKKFTLKLTADVQATPAEFAEALSDAEKRLQWELKLKSTKHKDNKPNSNLLVDYIGIAASHEISYDFEIMPSQQSR